MTGDRVQAPFGRRAVTVSGRSRHGPYVVLRCSDREGPRPQAGQFYMLAAAERWGGGADERPFLPRALSVLRAPAELDTLDFMLHDVGPGTRRLCELDAGDRLLIVGPLGKPFAAPRQGRRPLLVGGGVGVAPLAILQDALQAAEVVPSPGAVGMGSSPGGEHRAVGGGPLALLGFRDADHAAGAELMVNVRVATDDGSVGHHGLVIDLLVEELRRDPHSEVYACGPPLMLEAVRMTCAEHDVPGQLALESGMACGYGACFGCAVRTRQGLIRLCVDGPVLEATQLESAVGVGATAG